VTTLPPSDQCKHFLSKNLSTCHNLRSRSFRGSALHTARAGAVLSGILTVSVKLGWRQLSHRYLLPRRPQASNDVCVFRPYHVGAGKSSIRPPGVVAPSMLGLELKQNGTRADSAADSRVDSDSGSVADCCVVCLSVVSAIYPHRRRPRQKSSALQDCLGSGRGNERRAIRAPSSAQHLPHRIFLSNLLCISHYGG